MWQEVGQQAGGGWATVGWWCGRRLFSSRVAGGRRSGSGVAGSWSAVGRRADGRAGGCRMFRIFLDARPDLDAKTLTLVKRPHFVNPPLLPLPMSSDLWPCPTPGHEVMTSEKVACAWIPGGLVPVLMEMKTGAGNPLSGYVTRYERNRTVTPAFSPEGCETKFYNKSVTNPTKYFLIIRSKTSISVSVFLRIHLLINIYLSSLRDVQYCLQIIKY